VYFARQLVLERLLEARERLPAGIEPMMAPVTTGLGEVYQYYLEGPARGDDPAAQEAQLTDPRTVQDWVIRPLLKGVPGVIDVNSLGVFVKRYQVLVDPARLRKYNLAVRDVFVAVASNNANAGGNILERYAEKAIIRGVGLVRHTADIETIVVKEEGGTPVFVRDVAEVRIGHVVRHGAAVLHGEREVVAGIVLMLRGANAQQVVEGVVGLMANLMTLGGLAIAIGDMADGAVVVENVHRHLSDPAKQSLPRWEVGRDACLEVARPIAFGILIVTVVFLPLVTLEGIEGKMVKPLAYTISASWRAQRGWSRGRWRWRRGSDGDSCRFWTRAR
jgi:Cu/Ag efflux pump CusA